MGAEHEPDWLQRFLVDSWDGTVALAEQLGTKFLELRGIPWASSMPSEADPSAFMRRALCTMRKLLSADLWIDTSGAPVLPQIPASRDEPADFSWLQCFNALIGHNATRKARYALWAMACSDPDCRDQVKSPVCVHGLYAIHRHITLGREPCVRCSDHEMYFPPPATTHSVLPSISSVSLGSVGTDAIPAPTITDAERLLDRAASSASIALYLPTFSIGADLAMASFWW